MKTKRKIFFLLMLTVLCLSSHAQSRIEVINGDTLGCLPINYIRQANVKFIELRQCREENDSLFSQMRSYVGLTNNLRSSVTELKEADKLSQTIIADKQKIIEISDKELKKVGRKIKIIKIQRNALAGVSLILTGVVLVLIK